MSKLTSSFMTHLTSSLLERHVEKNRLSTESIIAMGAVVVVIVW